MSLQLRCFLNFSKILGQGKLLVHGRRERLGPPATFNKDTGAGYLSPKERDYARAARLASAERGRR